MSTRTRQSRLRNPGAAAVHRPARYDRRKEHRKVRRAAHVELSQMIEPDDLALPRPVNTSMKADPAERPTVKVGKQRFKVWKTKSWKRRTQVRARRAAAYQELARDL